MLGTIVEVLLALWVVGMVSSYTLGGFIHVLIVVAVIAALVSQLTSNKMGWPHCPYAESPWLW